MWGTRENLGEPGGTWPPGLPLLDVYVLAILKAPGQPTGTGQKL